jgi:hypothetical protein
MSFGYHLLCVSDDPKTRKGEKLGYLTGLCYLAPHKMSGMGNVCPHASKGCASACLNTAGRGVMPHVQAARIRKTRLFLTDRLEFLRMLRFDLHLLQSTAQFRRMIPVVRLNGTSDIPWEKYGVMEEHPSLQFYDYTKHPKRMLAYLQDSLPHNYHLTFSRSESNEMDCIRVLQLGGNTAVVFRKELPAEWKGYPVVRGDENDLRFLDGKNVVVGLTAKGQAKKDTSGFVIH